MENKEHNNLCNNNTPHYVQLLKTQYVFYQ